jgi:uncharacterized protein YgbK (DUF1537 family)
MHTQPSPRTAPVAGPVPRRIIVADDLTGAADACAKFVVHGFSGTVLLDLDTPPIEGILDGVDVVAVNADSRNVSAGDASQRVSRAGRLPFAAGCSMAFKKVDSTLRGHVGTEIRAALDAFSCSHAIVAPAFPAMSRTVRQGRLVVKGPGAPPPVDIPKLLADQSLAGCPAIPYPTARGEMAVTALRIAIERSLAAGAPAMVFDAESDLDLRAVVAAAIAAGGRPLWAGSAGLAGALATHLAAEDRRSLVPRAPRRSRGRVVLCLGSTHPATRAQREHLAEERRVTVVEAGGDQRRQAVEVRHGAHVLVVIDSAGRAADALARVPGGIDRSNTAGLVLSGGETAAGVCAALGATAIRLGGEVATGVPWGSLHGGPADGLPVVLKAGGFGTNDALVAAVDFLAPPAERHADT